ncbi:MAG: hypothetical protein RR193_01425 [Christensenellaceae bacterium]
MEKSLGEVFKSAGKTTRENFVTLLCATLVFFAICYLSAMITTLIADSSNYMAYASVTMVSVGWVYAALFFVAPLYMGFLAAVMHNYDQTGQKVVFKEAWLAALKSYGRYLLTMLVIMLFALVLVVVLTIVMMIVMLPMIMSYAMNISAGIAEYTQKMASGILITILPLMIVLAIVAYLFGLSAAFTAFIPQTEKKSGFKAYFSSFAYLFKGRFWRNLGHMLLIDVITVGIVIVAELLVMIPLIKTIVNGIINGQMMLDAQYFASAMVVPMLIIGIAAAFLQVFVMPYRFEVYKNAKLAYEQNKSQKLTNHEPIVQDDLPAQDEKQSTIADDKAEQ